MRKSFVTGLIILLPIVVTFLLISFIFNIFTSPFLDLVKTDLVKYETILPFLKSADVLAFIARVIILILFCLFIFVLGWLGRKFFFKTLLSWANAIFMKIPLFKGIYHTSKDLIDSIMSTDERKAFLHPLMVSFPSKKSSAVGFLSGTVPPECEKKLNQKLVPIFVPTAPHPISGYLVFASSDDVTNINMKNEEAVKFTVSCGIITPETEKEILNEK